MLGLGAIPAAGVIYLRAKMPESPRFKARVQGEAARRSRTSQFSDGVIDSAYWCARRARPRMGLGQFLRDRRMLMLLLGTAGTWFLFDYAYYGNTLSLPAILKEVDPTASLETKLLWTLGIFVVFAVPGYLAGGRGDGPDRPPPAAAHRVRRHGGRLPRWPPCRTHDQVAPFLAIFGLSYFFVEFGPNTTTFVLPSEVFPVSVRTTGHGIAAGVGKLGAFVGVFVVPQLQKHYGLRGCSPSPASRPSWGSPSLRSSPNRLDERWRRCTMGTTHPEFRLPKYRPPQIDPAYDSAMRRVPLSCPAGTRNAGWNGRPADEPACGGGRRLAPTGYWVKVSQSG